MTTSIHISALDGVVNVNSLFTLAVFIGLSWNPRDPSNSLSSNPDCNPTPRMAEDLIAFHVYSFASFLFSSLIALGLKQAIRLNIRPTFHVPAPLDPVVYYINKTALRLGMLVSGVGSVFGCVFLMMALINVVQIKLGTLSCGSGHSYAAVVPLLILVPSALFIYVSLILLQISVDGARECGRTSPEREAIKLAPCAKAAQDKTAQVSSTCCGRVKQIGKQPRCLCAVMLSNTAKSSEARPEIAVTIPKRCNIADRPVGYKCGAYTLP